MTNYVLPAVIDSSIFRAYDIRGVVGKTLTENIVYSIGRAFASEALAKKQTTVVVARDGRLSGPSLIMALKHGLCEGGCDVIDIGAVPTPLLYFANYYLQTGTGIMLTGSHNPVDHNGLKMVLDGDSVSEEGVQRLLQRIQRQDFTPVLLGKEKSLDIVPAYLERITQDIKLARSLKIVIDAGNGIAGAIAPKLYRQLGCEVIELYCDVDGSFPNHHPDPSQPKNLQDLQRAVLQYGADIGLAFDGDGDRLGLITNQGETIWPDQQIILFARDILSRQIGAEIIFDVKCSKYLAKEIQQYGGQPVMWKTGHSLIKKKLKESGAPFAGEMSGHLFFKERWYGFDDGLYAGARLLEILAKSPKTASELYNALPKSVTTPEINVAIADEEKFAFMKDFIAESQFEGANKITIDGLRIEYPDAWGLVRPSNTTPCLVLRFEADNPEALSRIQQQFRNALLALRPELSIPF